MNKLEKFCFLYDAVTAAGRKVSQTCPDPNNFYPPTPLDRRFRVLLDYALKQLWMRGHLDFSSWKTARKAAQLQVPTDLVFALICHLVRLAGDEVKPAKVFSQVTRARQGHPSEPASLPFTSSRRSKSDHVFDPKLLAQVAAPLAGVENVDSFIAARSAVDPAHLTSGQFLAHLYSQGERVLIFTNLRSQGELIWNRSTSDELIPVGHQNGVFFLPNPTDGQFRPNPRLEGKLSRRSEESVTSFRFALLESDAAPEKDWLRFLALAPIPISAIYLSGGRSIHALVQVNARTKSAWDQIITPKKAWLAKLGADPQALTAVRLSRLPQALRGERKQTLLFLNPQPTGVPIAELPFRKEVQP